MTKKNEVAKVEEKTTAVAMVVPDFMKADAGKGTEALTAADLEIPRLILLQSLSPEVTEGDERPGGFYHTILEETIAPKGEALRIVPIFSEIRYILWRPRHEGGGILARADDGIHWNPGNAEFDVKPYKDRPDTVKWKTAPTVEESGLHKFGSSDPKDPNSQPAAVKMWNYVVVLPDFPELGPMVLTFQRGMARIGANFSSKVKFADGAPSFGQIFKMTSKMDNSGAGDYFSLTMERDSYVSDPQQYASYKALYEQFSKDGVKIRDLEGAQDDGGSTASKAATPTPEGGIEV